jgi:hypothetical protein
MISAKTIFATFWIQRSIQISKNIRSGQTRIGETMTNVSIQSTEAPTYGKPVLFQGSLEAIETDEMDGSIIYVHGRGSVNTTEFNNFTVRFEGLVHNDQNGVGTGILIANYTSPNGDSLFAEASGRGAPTSTLGVNRIVENYTIKSGTGRYANVSGSFIVERLLTLATGVSSGTVSGTIVT